MARTLQDIASITAEGASRVENLKREAVMAMCLMYLRMAPDTEHMLDVYYRDEHTGGIVWG